VTESTLPQVAEHGCDLSNVACLPGGDFQRETLRVIDCQIGRKGNAYMLKVEDGEEKAGALVAILEWVSSCDSTQQHCRLLEHIRMWIGASERLERCANYLLNESLLPDTSQSATIISNSKGIEIRGNRRKKLDKFGAAGGEVQWRTGVIVELVEEISELVVGIVWHTGAASGYFLARRERSSRTSLRLVTR
jgi:hypothetical protein